MSSGYARRKDARDREKTRNSSFGIRQWLSRIRPAAGDQTARLAHKPVSPCARPPHSCIFVIVRIECMDRKKYRNALVKRDSRSTRSGQHLLVTRRLSPVRCTSFSVFSQRSDRSELSSGWPLGNVKNSGSPQSLNPRYDQKLGNS